MDLKHKHWAVIFIGILVATFVVMAALYAFGSNKAMAPNGETATTSPNDDIGIASPAPATHITENAAYYEIDLTYPSATPLLSVSAEANASAVAQMKIFSEERAAQFKKDGNFANLTHDDIQIMGLDQRKEALSSEYKIYSGSHTVSYVFLIYEDTLGAHPNGYYRTFTYSTQTGQEVVIKDLFKISVNHLSFLSSRARADLPSIISKMNGGYEGDSSMTNDGTAPKEENFQWFYIDGKNLVLIFPPYQVGPYALGTVIDPIPLTQLSSVLKAEYSN